MAEATVPVVLLHALGGSARSWDPVVAELGPALRPVPMDLPGFGDDAGSDRLSVDAMLDVLAGRIRDLVDGTWLLVGHSMGGKLATLLTARAEHGTAGLASPAGVLLVDASPPAPEPMAEDRRAEMLRWWAEGPIDEADAERYVDMNCAARLPAPRRAAAVADVRRSAREAWIEWLTRSSREDRSAEAGVLRVPALVLAGEHDADLGEDAQRRLNLPHYPAASLQVVPGAAHFVPEERPDAVARAIEALASRALR